jgi:DNA primase
VDAPAVTTLKKAPQVELILMGLVLKSRANFQFFLKEQIIQYFTDENVRKLLESAALVYGQSHGKFDKLVSLLTSFVDDPEFLIKFVFPNGVNSGDGDKDDFEREVRLIQDCVKRVKENALKKELEKLAQDVRKNPDPIKLMKLAELQKERLALQK